MACARLRRPVPACGHIDRWPPYKETLQDWRLQERLEATGGYRLEATGWKREVGGNRLGGDRLGGDRLETTG